MASETTDLEQYQNQEKPKSSSNEVDFVCLWVLFGFYLGFPPWPAGVGLYINFLRNALHAPLRSLNFLNCVIQNIIHYDYPKKYDFWSKWVKMKLIFDVNIEILIVLKFFPGVKSQKYTYMNTF